MAGACSTREVFFQASTFGGMRQTPVFEIGHHRSVLMDRGSKTRPHGQRENTGMSSVASTVPCFCQSHRICIVQHGKSATVESMKGSPNINGQPRFSKIRGRRWFRGFNRTGEPKSNWPGPAKPFNRLNKGRKHILGSG